MALWNRKEVVRVNKNQEGGEGTPPPPPKNPEVEDETIDPPEPSKNPSPSDDEDDKEEEEEEEEEKEEEDDKEGEGKPEPRDDKEDPEDDKEPSGDGDPDDSEDGEEESEDDSEGSSESDDDSEEEEDSDTDSDGESSDEDEEDSEDDSNSSGEDEKESEDDTESHEEEEEDTDTDGGFPGPDTEEEEESEDDSESTDDDSDPSEEEEGDSEDDSESSEEGEEESEDDSEPTEGDDESDEEESDDLGEEEDLGDESEEDPDGDTEGGDQEIDQDLIDQIREELEELDGIPTITQDIEAQLQKAVKASDEYRVDPDVKDIIYKVTGAPKNHVSGQLAAGLKSFGSLGVRLRYLFEEDRSRKNVGGLTRGKRLDSSMLHRFNSDLKDGRVPRIWQKEQERRNVDSVVSIAIDNSGSMSEQTKDLITEQLTMALGDVLQRMKIPFEMMGYTTEGYNMGGVPQRYDIRTFPVRINVVKTYDERFSPDRCVFPPANTRGCTTDLDCLHILVPRLLARQEPKKILFVFTDGQPACNGSVQPLQGRLCRGTKEYIDAAKAAGILVFGFGIQTDISHYYGEDSLTVTDLSKFSTQAVEKLTKLLHG